MPCSAYYRDSEERGVGKRVRRGARQTDRDIETVCDGEEGA